MAVAPTSPQLEANYDQFIAELTGLTRKYGVAIQSVGGVILADARTSFATSRTAPTSAAVIFIRSSRTADARAAPRRPDAARNS